MDRFSAMEVFVGVAERGGFAAAARHLRLSPPAVTRMVASLEHSVGTKLLVRTTRSVKLTAAGASYLARARRILADLDEAEREARAERVQPVGRFVVSAPTVFGRREVAPVVSTLVTRYPQLSAELTLSDRLVDLVSDGIDVAVRIGTLADSSLRSRVVGATRRVVVASPALIARGRKVRTPADLAGCPTIQLTPLSPLTEWRFEARARAREGRVAIRPALVTNSPDVAITHAERGGGYAMVLAYQARELITAGKLEVVLAAYEPPPIPIQLVFAAERRDTAASRAFVELVLARDWKFVDLRKRR